MPRVDTFFYGSYINFDVLAEVDIAPRPHHVARLTGYRLQIAPLANLIADEASEAFGIVTGLTHQELERLYAEHARDRLGGTYLPQAVLVEIDAGTRIPALCYLSHDMQPAPANPDYVERILAPARAYGFPQTYLDAIASFR